MAKDGVEFIEGEDVSIDAEDVPQTADTVFVIQHSECNEQLLDKVMDIAVALDKNLKVILCDYFIIKHRLRAE